jgi:hypothetical protein
LQQLLDSILLKLNIHVLLPDLELVSGVCFTFFGMCRLCIFLNTQKGINSSARICSAANWFLELIAVNLYLGMVVCFELLQKPACDF